MKFHDFLEQKKQYFCFQNFINSPYFSRETFCSNRRFFVKNLNFIYLFSLYSQKNRKISLEKLRKKRLKKICKVFKIQEGLKSVDRNWSSRKRAPPSGGKWKRHQKHKKCLWMWHWHLTGCEQQWCHIIIPFQFSLHNPIWKKLLFLFLFLSICLITKSRGRLHWNIQCVNHFFL